MQHVPGGSKVQRGSTSDALRASRSRRRSSTAVVVALLAMGLLAMGLVAGCSSGDDSSASTTAAAKGGGPAKTGGSTSTSTTVAKELTILVSNDDGVGAEGIDVLVKALKQMPDTSVVVAAPAANQSGTGGKTTDGAVTVTPTTMIGGEQATAVSGFPADSVVWALDGGVGTKPQLVVTGINMGQNIGSFIPISGTVGAARAAATRGVPALAVSAGAAPQTDYPTAAKLAVEWIDAHRADLLAGKLATTPAPVANLNVPTCSAGTVRGVLEVPAATTAPTDLTPVDCSAAEPATKPTDDITAFAAGWATLSDIGV